VSIGQHRPIDGTVVDGSELWSHNHSLTGSDVDSLGSGYSGATEWNWVRDSKVGSLYAITPESEGIPDRSKSTTSSPVGGTSRGPGHQLESVKVDQTNYTLAHDEAGRTATAFGMTMTWGPQGRLQAVSDANGLIEAYLYDADGRLTAIMDG
jgi:YD repeat-containing protein